MKKLLVMVMAVIATCSLFACAGTGNSGSSNVNEQSSGSVAVEGTSSNDGESSAQTSENSSENSEESSEESSEENVEIKQPITNGGAFGGDNYR